MATQHILLLASQCNTQTEQGESDGAEIKAATLEKDMELSLSAGKSLIHPFKWVFQLTNKKIESKIQQLTVKIFFFHLRQDIQRCERSSFVGIVQNLHIWPLQCIPCDFMQIKIMLRVTSSESEASDKTAQDLGNKTAHAFLEPG